MFDEIDLQVSDEMLLDISRNRSLSLNLAEMKVLKDHYHGLDRAARDIELETFAQTWSEHCCHKTFRGDVEYDGKVMTNILKNTIARVTRELDPPWCFSVFDDNAGIVDFDGDNALALKVETHNHPSALEPFGGAATGVGGVIRDILGVWGEPIANIDVLCFGPLDYPYELLPKGLKHPSFIHKYVVAGIGHYGNNMGIPTVNGSIFFDESYVGNPLVYCGTLGLVRKSHYRRAAKAGDALILAGGRTGRDGIHGVTFASIELSSDQERSVVQIGDPIEEEKVKRAIISIRDKGWGSAITDLGGGGLSSAVGEMAEKYSCGVRIYLDKAPQKHPHMLPWEIWTSESQERMLLSSRPDDVDRILEIFSDEEVEAVVIGYFTGGHDLLLYYEDVLVGEVDVPFLFADHVKARHRAVRADKTLVEPTDINGDLEEDLHSLLGMPNIASKEDVIRTYDHEVKAQTVLKPLQGLDGPGNGAVLKPIPDSYMGAVLSNGMNPEYGKIDPYHMAACGIDEAIRNNISMGGRRISLLDNFCLGNPEKPDRMYDLLQASLACYDTAIAFKTPFISGKDSLYNESSLGPVTPTLLITALGIMPDIRKAVSMELKKPGNPIYLLGETLDELGGSHYYKLKGHLGRNVPKVDPKSAKASYDKLTRAIDAGLVKSCHDLSEGGLGVALAETSFSGGLGAEIDLDKVPVREVLSNDKVFFSESQSRLLVEVAAQREEEFQEIMMGSVAAPIGIVVEEKELSIIRGKENLIKTDIDSLRRSWNGKA